MKRVVFVAVVFVAVIAWILVDGDPISVGKTSLGADVYGHVLMKGEWSSIGGEVGSPSITYFNDTNASIIELGVFPFPQKENSSPNEQGSDDPIGSSIKTRGDLTEYVEKYLGALGKGTELRTAKDEFAGYEANLITGSYIDQMFSGKKFLVYAWVFTDEEGKNHYLILESNEEDAPSELKQFKSSFHL
ncbi:MAG: hypothetical protein Q4A75_06565 [Peptostreptococcaceae bacterium]|nr:hypothetical protein [Peptostreptococcaceae bacterium]